ncbi:MAG: hypothetical protein FKY71_04675 [Spiribacter salinus]|uniref:Uncharacterized protein n=1 Tax=Spiribacter salinus TaxID=1335746 RepID=A0A540VU10_9GAMM|nr:MAG: hypothetical protein FKY71_04675 [Spiribacter salinus]
MTKGFKDIARNVWTRIGRFLSVARGFWATFWEGAGGSAVVIAGGVLVGILATLFYREIHESWPLRPDTKFDWGKKAAWFWAATAIFVLGVLAREKYRLAAYRRDRSLLHQDIDAVREVAHSMPPKDCLEKAAQLFRRVSRETDVIVLGASAANPGAEFQNWREPVNEAIRSILDALINIAHIFDSPHGDPTPVYRANVMWVRETQDAEDEAVQQTLWDWAQRLAPASNAEQFFASVDRLLVLDLNLTTNSLDVGNPEPDTLAPLCLGFTDSDGYRANINLPGAPECLSNTSMERIADSHEICSILRNQKKEYGDAALRKVDEYYKKNTVGRSIISMPITGIDPDNPESEEDWVPAVLSIYRNEPGILHTDDRATMFHHEIVPFLDLLARLCRLRSELDSKGGHVITTYTMLSEQTRNSDDDSGASDHV